MLILLKFLEFRQMGRHFAIRKTFTIATVISHTQGNEIITHNTTDIALVVQVTQRLILEKFVFCVSHGFSRITHFTPNEWVGNRHATKRLRSLCRFPT